MNELELKSKAKEFSLQGDFPKMVEFLSMAIELNPNDPQSYADRGFAQIKTGKFQEAIEDYTEVLKQRPGVEDAYYCRGHAKNSLGDYEGAIEDCDEAIAINPNVTDFYSSRGASKLLNEDTDGAIGDCTKAIDIDPDNEKAFGTRAAANKELRNYKTSLEDCSRVIELLPNDHSAYSDRGQIKYLIADYEGAVRDYSDAIEINGEIAGYYASRGGAKLALDEADGCIDDCNTAIDKDSKLADAYFNRGTAKCTLGNFEGGEQDCAEAIRLDPHDAYMFDFLAYLYYDWKQDIEKSICCLRICTELEPTSPKFLWKVAYHYMEWQTRTGIADPGFFNMLGKYGADCEQFYIGDIAFKEREKIAQGFYAKAFVNLFQDLRTDLSKDIDEYKMILFVAAESHMFSSLTEKIFYFSDVRTFNDTSDCPLLHEINQTDLIENVVYNNIRVRCLYNGETLEEAHEMWDRFSKHGGLAFRLNVKKDWLIENEIYSNYVKYTSEKEILIKCDSPEQVIQDGIFIKHEGYNNEREWRLVKFGEFNGEEGIKVNWAYNDVEKGMGVEIEGVYMALNISDASKLKAIELTKKKSINLYQMENGPGLTFVASQV